MPYDLAEPDRSPEPSRSAPRGRQERHRGSIPEVVHLLASGIDALVSELLPAARREGQEWVIGSPAGEPGRSMAIHRRGPKAGIWRDFAGAEGGDALSLIQACRRCSIAEALRWAEAWVGLDHGPCQSSLVTHAPGSPPDEDAEKRRRRAQQLWLAARPRLRDTPAELYLLGRGIGLRQLGRQPRALRYHPALVEPETGRFCPALVAAIVNDEGASLAFTAHFSRRGRGAAIASLPVVETRRRCSALRAAA